MATEEKKGITVKVDADLHAEVRGYLEQNGMTMGEFVAMLPNCGQGQLLPDAVFLSAQLYLYRPVRCLGARQ